MASGPTLQRKIYTPTYTGKSSWLKNLLKWFSKMAGRLTNSLLTTFLNIWFGKQSKYRTEFSAMVFHDGRPLLVAENQSFWFQQMFHDGHSLGVDIQRPLFGLENGWQLTVAMRSIFHDGHSLLSTCRDLYLVWKKGGAAYCGKVFHDGHSLLTTFRDLYLAQKRGQGSLLWQGVPRRPLLVSLNQ